MLFPTAWACRPLQRKPVRVLLPDPVCNAGSPLASRRAESRSLCGESSLQFGFKMKSDWAVGATLSRRVDIPMSPIWL